MADTVSVKYLYPPNFLDGDWDAKSGTRRVTVQLTGVSDGTGETDVKKIDLSDLKTTDGNAPSKTAVEWIDYHVYGMLVVLEWDRSPNSEICRMNATGSVAEGRFDWTHIGGKVDSGDDRTGDILLTTTGVAAGESYDITMCLRLKD